MRRDAQVVLLGPGPGGPCRRAQFGPANLRLLDDARLVKHFQTIQRAVAASPAALVIGMAGARSEQDRRRIRAAAGKAWRKTPVYVTNDLETALAAAPGPHAGLGVGFFVNDNIYLKINKNMDVFGQVYKEITTSYVDEIDPEKFMHAGIDGMLETLDPYTVFYGEKEGEEMDLITHGEYGGVGVSIGERDGYIIVIAPMDGYSAQKQGIRAGDKIIEIDGRKIFNTNPDSVKDGTRRARNRGENEN